MKIQMQFVQEESARVSHMVAFFHELTWVMKNIISVYTEVDDTKVIFEFISLSVHTIMK